MIPKLSHLVDSNMGPVFVTTDGVCGLILGLSLLDAESSATEGQIDSVVRWLNSIPSKILVRFVRRSQPGTEELMADRGRAIKNLGYQNQDLFLSIEIQGQGKFLKDLKMILGLKPVQISQQIELLTETVGQLAQAGVAFRQLNEVEIRSFFFWESNRSWRLGTSYLDLGNKIVGVVRLVRQSSEVIDTYDLPECLCGWQFCYQIVTSVRRIDRFRREMILRTRLRQEESGQDRLSQARAAETGDLLEDSFLRGVELFEFEMIILIESQSEPELREHLQQVQASLARLGDMAIETFGCLPSLAATMPGAPLHVPIFERDTVLPAFLPICAYGGRVQSCSEGGLLLLRRDRSPEMIDLLSKKHSNANTLIVGQSGKGKSVFTGLLTKSLLFDERVRVIKVDVGGSHRRECELLGGEEISLSLDQPSRLNPFSLVTGKPMTESLRAILGKFLEVLVLEDGEISVPKALRIEIDECLQGYFAGMPTRPSLDDFWSMSKDFSRWSLLGRWCGSGLYGNAFRDDLHSEKGEPRLRYYNFSQIFHAADKDFAQAGMAAVLAQFNFEVMANPDHRVVLICDETPFFINSCFEFFKFSMANVRKFGASIVLVVQLSQHLIKDQDTGLIDNAFHRFLFSKDGCSSEFGERLGLSEDQVSSVEKLVSIPGVRSEVIYQKGLETVKLAIELTPDEYWRVTSSQSDRIKIEKLRSAVPELSLKEALGCLARIG